MFGGRSRPMTILQNIEFDVKAGMNPPAARRGSEGSIFDHDVVRQYFVARVAMCNQFTNIFRHRCNYLPHYEGWRTVWMASLNIAGRGVHGGAALTAPVRTYVLDSHGTGY